MNRYLLTILLLVILLCGCARGDHPENQEATPKKASTEAADQAEKTAVIEDGLGMQFYSMLLEPAQAAKEKIKKVTPLERIDPRGQLTGELLMLNEEILGTRAVVLLDMENSGLFNKYEKIWPFFETEEKAFRDTWKQIYDEAVSAYGEPLMGNETQRALWQIDEKVQVSLEGYTTENGSRLSVTAIGNGVPKGQTQVETYELCLRYQVDPEYYVGTFLHDLEPDEVTSGKVTPTDFGRDMTELLGLGEYPVLAELLANEQVELLKDFSWPEAGQVFSTYAFRETFADHPWVTEVSFELGKLISFTKTHRFDDLAEYEALEQSLTSMLSEAYGEPISEETALLDHDPDAHKKVYGKTVTWQVTDSVQASFTCGTCMEMARLYPEDWFEEHDYYVRLSFWKP